MYDTRMEGWIKKLRLNTQEDSNVDATKMSEGCDKSRQKKKKGKELCHQPNT